jgi:predicted HicB family RNase H-like nuclease
VTVLRALKRISKGAVDEYLAVCRAEGKTPDKPFKGSFNIRVTQELHKRAALYAEEHDLKLNAVVQVALQEYLTHAE